MSELIRIYAPGDAYRHSIRLTDDAALIRESLSSSRVYKLPFADSSSEEPIPRYWRPARDFPPTPANRCLEGVSIAIDPGHIGGSWAKLEERWFRIGGSKPVTEGDMTLIVARKVRARLEALGADVSLVRSKPAPVTHARPKDLRNEAVEELQSRGVTRIRESYDGPNDPEKHSSINWTSELLFYRMSEIRERAHLVNDRIRPDLVVALHFNAEAWGDPNKPNLVDKNHLHLLVNGAYSAGELSFDDVRFEMLQQLLGRTAAESIAVSDAVAIAMRRATGLPPYIYHGNNAVAVGNTGYVWARNLLANRLYRCPVVYVEPYVMNSHSAFKRIQIGDYEGTRMVDGKPRKSIFSEYADGVTEGLANYYSRSRSR